LSRFSSFFFRLCFSRFRRRALLLPPPLLLLLLLLLLPLSLI
jgi:hypothetical protein